MPLTGTRSRVDRPLGTLPPRDLPQPEPCGCVAALRALADAVATPDERADPRRFLALAAGQRPNRAVWDLAMRIRALKAVPRG